MTPLRARMVEDMKLAGLSARTQKAYLDAVKALSKHYGNRPPDQLREEEVRQYLLGVRDQSARGNVQDLPLWHAVFLPADAGHGLVAVQKKIRLPRQKRLPRTFSHAEAQRIPGAIHKPIHRGGFSLNYACGLRFGEAAALPVTAIDKASGLLRVVGKGNEERMVPVPRPVHECFRRMRRMARHRDRRWFFPNSRRSGLVAANVLSRTFADAVAAAQLPGGLRAPPLAGIASLSPASSIARKER